jgi:N6-adenosine-specific RNA methylase IME4
VNPWPFHGLEPGTFSVVYADPPWMMWGDPNKDQAAGKHYELMSDDALKALPVRDLLGANGALFMWATCPRLDAAVEVMKAWGLHFRGVAYVWVKTTKAGKIIEGQGVRPTLVKPTTELVLAGTTCKRGRPLPLLTEAQGQVVLAPRGAHSEKPEEVRRRIEGLLGPVPRVELFARRRTPGWSAWGLELPPT